MASVGRGYNEAEKITQGRYLSSLIDSENSCSKNKKEQTNISVCSFLFFTYLIFFSIYIVLRLFFCFKFIPFTSNS